jgi:hypothetical protein
MDVVRLTESAPLPAGVGHAAGTHPERPAARRGAGQSRGGAARGLACFPEGLSRGSLLDLRAEELAALASGGLPVQ